MGLKLQAEQAGASSKLEQFPTTRWSLVALARDATADRIRCVDQSVLACRSALETLLPRYLPALRAHLLAKAIPPSRVEDLVQGFVTERIIERNLLQHAQKARGRFRSFLLACLDNFVANQFRFDAAGKRAPAGAKLVALAGGDDACPDLGALPEMESHADIFDVVWAREALAEGLRRMRQGCEASGRGDLWDMFVRRVLDPALYGASKLEYTEMVKRFGYKSPKQAANALVTVKRRFVAALRSVLAEYVEDEEEVDREIASLGAVLASPRARYVASAYPADASPLCRAANDNWVRAAP